MAYGNSEISFKIEKSIGVLSTNERSGWTKEVNLVSWNGNTAKIDIRDWSPDHSKMGKGVSLTRTETVALLSSLNSLNLQ